MSVPRVRWTTVIARAVDDGLALGYGRAHKHTDTPTREQLLTEMDRAIWEALDEVIVFESED